MDSLGLNIPLVVVQVCNLALGGAWIMLALIALIRLRRAGITPRHYLGWAALIVLVPFLGALAVLILYPQRSD